MVSLSLHIIKEYLYIYIVIIKIIIYFISVHFTISEAIYRLTLGHYGIIIFIIIIITWHYSPT
jgi:hypothetical protein